MITSMQFSASLVEHPSRSISSPCSSAMNLAASRLRCCLRHGRAQVICGTGGAADARARTDFSVYTIKMVARNSSVHNTIYAVAVFVAMMAIACVHEYVVSGHIAATTAHVRVCASDIRINPQVPVYVHITHPNLYGW